METLIWIFLRAEADGSMGQGYGTGTAESGHVLLKPSQGFGYGVN